MKNILLFLALLPTNLMSIKPDQSFKKLNIENNIGKIAFNHENTTLAIGAKKTCLFYSLTNFTYKEITNISDTTFGAISWSPDDKFIILNTVENSSYHVSNAKIFDTKKLHQTNPKNITCTCIIHDIKWGPDNKIAISHTSKNSNNYIVIIDLNNKTNITFSLETYVLHIEWANSDTLILQEENKLYALDISNTKKSPQEVFAAEGNLRTIALSLKNQDLAVIENSRNDSTIYILDKKYNKKNTLTYNNYLSDLAWGPNGEIAAISDSNEIVFWNSYTQNNQLDDKPHTIRTKLEEPLYISWSSDGKYLAVSSSKTQCVHVWTFDAKKNTKANESEISDSSETDSETNLSSDESKSQTKNTPSIEKQTKQETVIREPAQKDPAETMSPQSSDDCTSSEDSEKSIKTSINNTKKPEPIAPTKNNTSNTKIEKVTINSSIISSDESNSDSNDSDSDSGGNNND